MTSYQVSDSLHLVRHSVAKASQKAVAVELPTDNFLLIDCSGSMSYDLPKVRDQIKRKIPKILKEGDTLSILWFSGRKEFGVLLEAEPVATLKDLKDVEQAIDRWLRPVGLTGFKEPLEAVPDLVDRVLKKRKGKSVTSMTFMSDGCDNQWPRGDILKAAEAVGTKVNSATFVEYGYYADRDLLSKMAEKCGGVSIFAEDFDRYAPTFEAILMKKATGAPRIEVKVEGDPVGGFVYSLVDGDLVTFSVEGGSVKVPEDLKEFWYLSPVSVGSKAAGKVSDGAKDSITPGNDSSAVASLPAVYAALALYSQRMKSDVVFALLRAVGDVRFIEQFANCFGKQKYSEFMEAAKNAAFDSKQQLTQGFDPNKVPRDDAFTVLDLLRVLASDDANHVLLESKDFKYSKIGRGRIDSSSILTAEEQEQISKLTEEMGNTKDAKKIAALAQQIADVTANKKDALKFVPEETPNGYPISALTTNESRPNISFRVYKKGTVDISSRVAGVDAAKNLPTTFPTGIYRNYAVVKDGLVNLERLPVRLTAGTIRQLKDAGMPIETIVGCDGETDAQTRIRAAKASDDRPVNVVFDLRSLPIINRKMVKETSAKALFETAYEMAQVKASQKVFNFYRKELCPKKAEGLIAQYGDAAAEWLGEQGFTDHGFNPKVVQAESTDFYMGKELKVSLKALSTLPTVADVKDKIAKNKLTPSAALMAPAVKEVEAFLNGDIYKNSKKKAELLEGWLDGQATTSTKRARELMYELSQITFTIIVGQTWFKEFSSLDENSLTIDVGGGQKVEGSVVQKEIEIKI